MSETSWTYSLNILITSARELGRKLKISEKNNNIVYGNLDEVAGELNKIWAAIEQFQAISEVIDGQAKLK